MKKVDFKRLISTILGVVLVGIGVGGLNLSNLGADPFSCMNYGLSSVLNLQFGTWQLILNIILFVPMLIVGRRYIGIGTIFNMAGVGYVAQFIDFILVSIGLDGLILSSMVFKILFMLISVVITCFGVALYTKASLGISPYDALAYILEDAFKGKIKFKWLRIITDIVCVSIGFISHSTIGIGTVVMMFFTGPLVQFFKDMLNPTFDEQSQVDEKSML
ncbi:MAG: YitT family protein [Oscillospiraceae bacterium]